METIKCTYLLLIYIIINIHNSNVIKKTKTLFYLELGTTFFRRQTLVHIERVVPKKKSCLSRNRQEIN